MIVAHLVNRVNTSQFFEKSHEILYLDPWILLGT